MASVAFTESRYDLVGRKWLEIDAENKAIAFVHDSLGRLKWVITKVDPAVSGFQSPLPTAIAGWESWAKGNRSASDSTATHFVYDETVKTSGRRLTALRPHSHQKLVRIYDRSSARKRHLL